MDKRFWGVLIAIFLVFGGILFYSNHNKKTPSASVQPSNHVQGTTKNNVTLVEYGDFQCPACSRYYPVVKQITEKYKDRVQFQFRNLPLSQIHKNAFAGSRAAEAAANQGKFWEMHDLLYENQTYWSESTNAKSYLEQYAKQLKLNMSQFDKDFSSERTNAVINADINAFNKTGQPMQTPSFFLNGKAVNPNATTQDFEKILNEALKNKQ